MFENNVPCDLYVGKGAGRKLLKEMREASHSIQIVSPYLTPDFVQELTEIKYSKPSIFIQLVTMDKIEEFYNNPFRNARKLIRQFRGTRKRTKKKFVILRTIKDITGYTFLCSLIVSMVIWNKETEWMEWAVYSSSALLITYLILWLVVSKTRIYIYRYMPLFSFKIFKKYNNRKSIIHSKIYIFDHRVAYLGSLNYTKNGMKNNYETRSRTEDPDTIGKLTDEVEELYRNSLGLREYTFEQWAYEIYKDKEPIN